MKIFCDIPIFKYKIGKEKKCTSNKKVVGKTTFLIYFLSIRNMNGSQMFYKDCTLDTNKTIQH